MSMLLNSAVLAAAGEGLGPELWPEPAFAASTGLVLNSFDGDPAFPKVQGGQLLFGATGVDDGECLGTLTASMQVGHTYRITATSAVGGEGFELSATGGGSFNPIAVFAGASNSPQSIDVTVQGADAAVVDVVNSYQAAKLSGLSIKEVLS